MRREEGGEGAIGRDGRSGGGREDLLGVSDGGREGERYG